MNDRVRCPWCLDRTGSLGSRPWGKHLSVDVVGGTYLCYRCGSRGRLTKSVARLLGIDVTLVGEFHETLHVEKEAVSQFPTVPLLECGLALSGRLRYVRDRGVSIASIRDAELGVVCGDVPRHMLGAISIPVHDDTAGFVYRLAKGGYKACLNDPSSAIHGGSRLFGSGLVWVVEGPFDKLRMYPETCVALLGKDVGKTKIDRLVSYRGDIIIAFDGDAWEDGRVLAKRIYIRKSVGRVWWVRLPAGEDPASLGRDEVLKLERFDA